MKSVLYVYVWGPPLSETGQAPPGTGRLTGYKFRTQTFCANDFPAFGWKYYFRDIPVWPRNLQTMRKGQAASLLSAGRRLFDLAKLSSPSKWVIKHFYSNSYVIAVAPGPRDQFFRKFKVGKVEAWCLNYSWEMLDTAGAQPHHWHILTKHKINELGMCL